MEAVKAILSLQVEGRGSRPSPFSLEEGEKLEAILFYVRETER